ncbi:hypothetical protein LUZ60_000314 [Juncus effusus]|nr:hypothetical protein LUZ60_000314 [Juncus effusus]
MGNCQAAEAATVVIQHTGGKVERLYWSTSAAEVMRKNPGHYVALVTLRVVEPANNDGSGEKKVRLTRVKLLKPTDMLLLGQVYRLITSHEVTKALRERKNEKLKKLEEFGKKDGYVNDKDEGENSENADQEDRYGHKSSNTNNSNTPRIRQNWRPSLQSIDEVGT